MGQLACPKGQVIIFEFQGSLSSSTGFVGWIDVRLDNPAEPIPLDLSRSVDTQNL